VDPKTQGNTPENAALWAALTEGAVQPEK